MQEADLSAAQTKTEKFCTELARAGGVELHNVASVAGGMLAQEAIKMVTKQYVPVNGYCVVDLISATTGVVGAA